MTKRLQTEAEAQRMWANIWRKVAGDGQKGQEWLAYWRRTEMLAAAMETAERKGYG